MIRKTARIAKTVAAVFTAVMVISTPLAQEQPDLHLPNVPLQLSSFQAAQLTLNPTTPLAPRIAAAPTRSFYKGYLLPGLEKQLSRVGVLHTSVLDRPDLGHYENHEALTAISERMFEKGASRALRSYLAEITGLETMVLNLAGRNGMLSEGGGERSRFNLGIGISSAMPRVDLGYRVGDAGNFRLSLCTNGNIDLNYGRYTRLSSTRIYAGYDTKEGTGNIGLRVSF